MIRWLWAFVDRPLARFEASAAFWSAATGTALSPPRGALGEFATLLPETGGDPADPWVKLQGVLSGEGGAHLDIDVDDVDAVTHAALEEHGATLVHREGVELSVLRSPGGQPFCVSRWDGRFARRPRTGAPGLLDQLCLDIAPEVFADEVAFWSGFTGWAAHPTGAPEFTRLEVPGSLPLHILLQRRWRPGSPPGAHLDLACGDDVAGVRARHEALGAEHVADGAHWQVMRDPAGGLYCLTERDPRIGRLPQPG